MRKLSTEESTQNILHNFRSNVFKSDKDNIRYNVRDNVMDNVLYKVKDSGLKSVYKHLRMKQI